MVINIQNSLMITKCKDDNGVVKRVEKGQVVEMLTTSLIQSSVKYVQLSLLLIQEIPCIFDPSLFSGLSGKGLFPNRNNLYGSISVSFHGVNLQTTAIKYESKNEHA